MGIRKRRVYVYPGVHRAGVAGVVLDDSTLVAIGVGSVPRDILPALLADFKPDEMVVAVDKLYDQNFAHVPVPESVKKFKFAHPGWHTRKVPVTDRTRPSQGVYVNNVWKLFFDDSLRRGNIVFSKLNVEDFNQGWVETHRPPRIKHDR